MSSLKFDCSAQAKDIPIKGISGSNQEVWGVDIDFQSIHSKWTIAAILQHMGFYATTGNPNVMMKGNHNTQSCECIIKCQDGLHSISTTPEEMLHMLKDKYRINLNIQDEYPHDPGGRDIFQCHIKKYLEKLYVNVNILLNNNLPTEIHIAFETIKLLIKKGNLNYIHNKNSCMHLNHSSRKKN